MLLARKRKWPSGDGKTRSGEANSGPIDEDQGTKAAKQAPVRRGRKRGLSQPGQVGWAGRLLRARPQSANRKTASRRSFRNAITCLDQTASAASFRFLRHHARRPPVARIKPGNPAPTAGEGTAAGVKL